MKMKLKIKNEENITIFEMETKLNMNVEHTITTFYNELLDGEHDYQIDMQGTKLEDMYKIVLTEDDETLEEIDIKDMQEIISHEIMDERQKEYGEQILKEIEEDILTMEEVE